MSQIAHIEYSEETKVLTVIFEDGSYFNERNVESKKEAANILKARFSQESARRPAKPHEKNDGHLSVY